MDYLGSELWWFLWRNLSVRRPHHPIQTTGYWQDMHELMILIGPKREYRKDPLRLPPMLIFSVQKGYAKVESLSVLSIYSNVPRQYS